MVSALSAVAAGPTASNQARDRPYSLPRASSQWGWGRTNQEVTGPDELNLGLFM
jgi:hypothetical protein